MKQKFGVPGEVPAMISRSKRTDDKDGALSVDEGCF